MKRLIFLLAISAAFSGLAFAQAPTFQAGPSGIVASTGADITLTLSAHATDDILLCQVMVRDVDDTVTLPAGWANVTGSPWDRSTVARYWLIWKRAASASETNPLFDKDTATGDTYGRCTVWRGTITSGNPWNGTPAMSTSTADPATYTGVTTDCADTRIAVFITEEDNDNTAVTVTATDPATFTEEGYATSAAGADAAMSTQDNSKASSGATGNISANFTSLANNSGAAVIALRNSSCTGGAAPARRRVAVY